MGIAVVNPQIGGMGAGEARPPPPNRVAFTADPIELDFFEAIRFGSVVAGLPVTKSGTARPQCQKSMR
jgi:hypothetical protein